MRSVGFSAVVIAAVASVLSLACSVDATPADPSSAVADAGATSPACEDGATRCEGDGIATCTTGAFGAGVACEGDAVCRDDVCRVPSAQQIAQAVELTSMLTYLKDETAWHSPIDWEALRVAGQKRIYGGDGSDHAYFGALFGAFMAVPQGHQGLILAEGCGTLVPYHGYAQRGACGRPHARGIVVTNVSSNATNVLGLKKGDIVSRVGSAAGSALLPSLAERPLCATSRPSTSFRDAATAASFVDLLTPGEEIVIESAEGATRTAKVPNVPLTGKLSSALFCQDPFGRNTRVAVEAEVRPDGVGVLRLPGFTDPDQPFPTNPTPEALAAYRAKFVAKILTAFEKVKAAPAIVWDIRGNGGGLTNVGLEIASGFPGADAAPLSYCQARVPKSDPPTFYPFKGAEYALTPGGAFAYGGKVAILIDGLDYSAADYFPLAVKSRTSALLFGAPTAGAFGATSKSKAFAGPPAFNVSVDLNRCATSVDDLPLEGESVTPHVAVDYDPKDLAANKDTVLERAVSELLK